jgi:hypothetical protein
LVSSLLDKIGTSSNPYPVSDRKSLILGSSMILVFVCNVQLRPFRAEQDLWS